MLKGTAMLNRLLWKKIIFTVLFFILSLLQNSFAQQKGEFDVTVEGKTVCFYVPYSYSSSTPIPLVVANHPGGQTPPESMRDMLRQAAENLGFILMCPDDRPNYDASSIQPALDYVTTNYTIDMTNIVMTGYSAGGNTTFRLGFQNFPYYKGIILIAAGNTLSPQYYNILPRFPVAGICGTADDYGYHQIMTDLFSVIEQNGGIGKFISVPGVGHFGEYFWGSQIVADWTECYNFIQDAVFPPDQVALTAPEDGVENLMAPIEFSWEEAEGADSYTIEFSKNIDFSSISLTNTNSKTTYSSSKFDKGDTYFWRVRALKETAEGEWSYIRSFTTAPAAPTKAPAIVKPIYEAEYDTPIIVFEWNRMDGADAYLLEVYKDGESSAYISEEIAQSDDGRITYTYESFEIPASYTWKLKAVNAGGEGPWSNDYKFSTIVSAPDEQANIAEPLDGAEDLEQPITLKWSAIDKAASYRVNVFEGDNSEAEVDETFDFAGEGAVEYTLPILNEGTLYKWRVQGINDAGEGPWTDLISFTTYNSNSVDEIAKLYNFQITPNPVSGVSVISFTMPDRGNVELRISDIAGRTISIPFNAYYEYGSHSEYWDSGDLPNGIYIYTFISGNVEISGKIIVSK